jgi:putative transposase
VVGIKRSTHRYTSQAKDQSGLRQRLRELAATHVRYGYRRLTVLLRREGWPVNAKRVYRLYREEGLIVRTKQRKKIARRQRVPQPLAVRRNQCWSMDFVTDKLSDGRAFRILTVVDQFTRECVWLEADRSMTGAKVAEALTKAAAERDGFPESITCDNVLNARSFLMRDAAIARTARSAVLVGTIDFRMPKRQWSPPEKGPRST